MEDRTLIGTPNLRRANRVLIVRPVRIVSPEPLEGKTVNVSANGMLILILGRRNFRHGEPVAVEIPHLDGNTSIVRNGRIVRVERQAHGTAVAIELV